MPYRRSGAVQEAIEGGDYSDLQEMLRAVVRAARALGKPVVSDDRVLQWSVGFSVGPHLWTITISRAKRTATPWLREQLGSHDRRVIFAQWLTQAARSQGPLEFPEPEPPSLPRTALDRLLGDDFD
jgi:phytoene dehydrogenase-like protein